MIQVKVYKEKEEFKKIEILGHALFDNYGKDIVCASCSSIVITTVNASLRFDENSLTYRKDNEGLKITINNNDKITQTLILSMIELLTELGTDYPKNVKVNNL